MTTIADLITLFERHRPDSIVAIEVIGEDFGVAKQLEIRETQSTLFLAPVCDATYNLHRDANVTVNLSAVSVKAESQ